MSDNYQYRVTYKLCGESVVLPAADEEQAIRMTSAIRGSSDTTDVHIQRRWVGPWHFRFEDSPERTPAAAFDVIVLSSQERTSQNLGTIGIDVVYRGLVGSTELPTDDCEGVRVYVDLDAPVPDPF